MDQHREAGEPPQRTNPLDIVFGENPALPLGGEQLLPLPPEGPAKLLLHNFEKPGEVERKDPDEVLPSERVARQDYFHLVFVMGRVAVMSAVTVAHVDGVLPVEQAGDPVEELVEPSRLEHRLV